jgi:hypothetical protein
LYPFDVISAFLIAENDRKTISAARGRVRPEVKSPFDSNPNDYWYIITIAESLCADEFLQVTFRYFLREFKGRNIGLKNNTAVVG